MKIVISSGHGKFVSGARDIIDEVTEARKVTDRVAELLREVGVSVDVFHDDVSRNQRDNVNTIVRYHNSRERDLDVSIHFNSVASGTRDAGIGVETLYSQGDLNGRELASRVSTAISRASGLILRRGDGTFPVTNIGFLNNTNKTGILIEVCFVNSRTDVRIYNEHFEDICIAIAEGLSGQTVSKEDRQQKYPISEDNIKAMELMGVINSPV